MIIGVISDTHDNGKNILKAVDILNKENCELVIHCGDICSPYTLNFFRELKCPMKVVFGNNDGDEFGLLDWAKKGSTNIEFGKYFLQLKAGGRKIGVFHGYSAELKAGLFSLGLDAVFTGHTHIQLIEMRGKTLHVNPGAVSGYTPPAKISDKATLAIYDSEANTARIIEF